MMMGIYFQQKHNHLLQCGKLLLKIDPFLHSFTGISKPSNVSQNSIPEAHLCAIRFYPR